MKTIITTSSEMRQLTGTFYANINFDKVKTDIILETENLQEVVGSAIIAKGQELYEQQIEGTTPLTDDEAILLHHIQLPIAVGAAYRYYQSNSVSHDDNGRKAKLDKDNESMAWEWQINKDDEAALRKHRAAVDRLIKYLDTHDLPEWTNSTAKPRSRDLFLHDTEAFNTQFYIDASPRFYYIIKPIIREVQQSTIRKVLGTAQYDSLLAAFQAQDTTPEQDQQLQYIQPALAMLTMAKAVKRMTVQVMPEGVVQGYKSFMQGLNANNIAMMPAIEWYSRFLEKDAHHHLNELKKEISRDTEPYKMLPDNDPRKKYART